MYTIDTHKGPKTYRVEVGALECPSSLVTADSWALLDLVEPALEAVDGCGVKLEDVLPVVLQDARVLDACLVVRRAEAARKVAVGRGCHSSESQTSAA